MVWPLVQKNESVKYNGNKTNQPNPNVAFVIQIYDIASYSLMCNFLKQNTYQISSQKFFINAKDNLYITVKYTT